MKRTLLDLTQSILSSLDSDEVNSISDTTESLQVANIIKTVYLNMVPRLNLPDNAEIFKLDSSVDSDQPILMYKPDYVDKIEWIKYLCYDDSDLVDNYKYITVLPPYHFLEMVNGFNVEESYISSTEIQTGKDTFTFYYRTDRDPSYCTIIKDQYIIFDAYDSTLENTLQSSKTMCGGQVSNTFLMEDSFVPPLDDVQVSLLLNEAKALAFLELKQMSHPKAEQEAKRQWSSSQKTKYTIDTPSDFDALPHFGRWGKRYSTSLFRNMGWRR